MFRDDLECRMRRMCLRPPVGARAPLMPGPPMHMGLLQFQWHSPGNTCSSTAPCPAPCLMQRQPPLLNCTPCIFHNVGQL